VKAISRVVLLALFCVVMTFALPLMAVTPPGFLITDGTNTISVDQGGNVTFSMPCSNCSTTSVSAQPGHVKWVGSLGGFSSISATGFSKPVLPGAPDLDISLDVRASTGGNLIVEWSDIGFPEPNIANLVLSAGGTVHNGTVTVSGFADNTNTPFGTGVLGGTLGPFSPISFSGGPLFGPGPTQAPFSRTDSVTLNLGAGGSGGGDFELQALPAKLALSCPASTGQVNVPYNSPLKANGGVPPYTFSIISGMLPDGLTLDGSTGAITGTPTNASTFSFTAQVQDSSGLQGQDTVQTGCSITIQPATQLYEISGYTYSDNNQNMIYDNPPDTPIGGVTITLTDCSKQPDSDDDYQCKRLLSVQ
jgi:hypothetical protein